MYQRTVNYGIWIVALSFLPHSCSSPPDPSTLEFTRILDLDAEQGENPFGIIALDDGNLMVSMPFRKELRIFDPQSGAVVKSIATPASFAFMKMDEDGTVLTGSTPFLDPGFNPDDPTDPKSAAAIANTGVWRIDVEQETAIQIVQMVADIVPTHFVPLGNHEFLVSNIFGDNIFHVDASGNVSIWAQDPLLAGSADIPGPEGRPPFPVGIEGVVRNGNEVIGVVADHGRIVRIPILPDSSAGTVEVLFEASDELLGIASFLIDEYGDMIALSGFQSKVWHIDLANGFTITTLADNDSPSQVDTAAQIVRSLNDGEFFFTNNAFVVNKEKGPPRPGLTRIVRTESTD